MVIGAAVQVIGYAISVPAPPYPVLVFAYFTTGFGVALQVSYKPALQEILP